MNKIGLSQRECKQIFAALVAYRNIFAGMQMPVTDQLLDKFKEMLIQYDNERQGNSDQ